MRKEIIFAIAAGGVLGLVIAFGVWRVNSSFNNKADKSNSNSAQSSPIPKSEFAITIAKPEDKDVLVESETIISGLSKPNVAIAISAEEKDYLATSDQSGTFEEKVSLLASANYIQVYAFDETGNVSGQNLTLVYSSEFAKTLEALKVESPEPGTSEAGVREKVQKKVEDALKKPKAYIGTVTDISEKTIQIKAESGEIQQILAEDTTFVKIGKTNKEVKLADLAIGDYIIAMGFKNGNSVLTAGRILITTRESFSRQVYYGKVAKATSKELGIELIKNGEPVNAAVSSKTDVLVRKDGKLSIAKYSSIKEGSVVFVFGTLDEKAYDARTIIVIPQPTVSASPTP